MAITLNKDKCAVIDGAFLVLKDDVNNEAAKALIKKTLEASFPGYEFSIVIIPELDKNEAPLVMSVYPDRNTIDKVIEAVLKNEDEKVIQKLWESNKKWTIEIDPGTIIGKYGDLSDKELTSLLLHEVGHIVFTNSLPNKIATIFKYEIAKTNIYNKALLKNKLFRTILSFPILDACINDTKRSRKDIHEEVKADAFVKKVGYQKELTSSLTKLINLMDASADTSVQNKMKNSVGFSVQTLDDFRTRRDKLAKNNLLALRESCGSPYVNEILDEFIETVFEDGANFAPGRKVEYMQERADMLIDDVLTTEAFFGLGKKKLKRIDPADIDYIRVKLEGVNSVNDKMMLISYLHSKLDIVQYYISLLTNPKTAKKVSCPHTLSELQAMEKDLIAIRELVLNKRLPEKNKYVISYPAGYETW